MDWTRVLWTNMAQENSGSVMAVVTRITLYAQNCWDDDARMQSWGAMREIVCNLLFIKIRNQGENLPLWDGFQTHFLIPCHSFWVRGHGFPILPQLEGKTTTWSNGFTNQTARNSLWDTHTHVYTYIYLHLFPSIVDSSTMNIGFADPPMWWLAAILGSFFSSLASAQSDCLRCGRWWYP